MVIGSPRQGYSWSDNGKSLAVIGLLINASPAVRLLLARQWKVSAGYVQPDRLICQLVPGRAVESLSEHAQPDSSAFAL